jgi:putative spermidine/putrescine transport system permease protein
VSVLRMLARGLAIALLAFLNFGPLANLLLWAFAERWYFPGKIPQEFGFAFWGRVFSARGGAVQSLVTCVWIALLTVAFCLAVAVPAGYALARLKLPARAFILLVFLLPQAIPNLPIYVNIARMFYELRLNGTAWCWRCGSPAPPSPRWTTSSRRRRATSAPAPGAASPA